MPVDYQMPIDAQTAPQAYYRQASADAAGGQAQAGFIQATYDPAGAAPAAMPVLSYGDLDQAPGSPAMLFHNAALQSAEPVARMIPAVQTMAIPALMVPVQYSQPAPSYYPQPYAGQGYAMPAYQPVQAYQSAPVYLTPGYAPQPAYQAQPQPYQAYQSYQPYQAAPTYPTEAYGSQGFATQSYGGADYAIAPGQGAYQPQPSYMPQPAYAPQQGYLPQPGYTPYMPSYAPPSYAPAPYAPPVYGQVTGRIPTAPTRRTTRAARRQQKTIARVRRAPIPAPLPSAPAPYEALPPLGGYGSQQPMPGSSAPPQTYVLPPAPQPSYAPPAPMPSYGSAPGYGSAPAPTPGYAAPMIPAPFGQPSYGYGGPGAVLNYSNDPEMDRINAEIATLSADKALRVEGGIGFRYRDGERGLGQLNEVSGRAAVSTGLGAGRIELSASPVYIESGVPTANGLTRFGTNPVAQATALAGGFTPVLTTARRQYDSGIAAKLAYDTRSLTVDVGTTPIGFGKTKFQGGARWAPRLSTSVTARVFGETRPVTDSVLAYAGTNDPVSGVRWGQVMRTGGGGGLSYDRGQGGGIYVDTDVYHYDGRNVRDNFSVETNVGGYLTAWRQDTATLTLGVNFNYQHYDNNQNFFSYGHGGYFSPKQYGAVSFPVRYRMVDGPFSLDLTGTPGFQSYRQNDEAVFPTSDPLQATLLRLQQGNANVLARYAEFSKSGFGFALQGVGWYRIGEGTNLGAEVRLNTFGGYNEAQGMLRLRQTLSSAR